MADHAAKAADAPAQKGAKGKSKKKLLMIALPVLLLAGGAGAYFAGVIPGLGGAVASEAHGEADKKAGGHGETAHAEAAKPSAHGEAKPGGHGDAKSGDPNARDTVFFDLPDQLVNLNSAGRKTAFLKVSISLELDKKDDVPKITAVMPRIIDNFQTYMRELKIEDLRGSAGLYRLREELLVRVNAAASPAKVNDVLFREMLVQ